MPEKKDKKIRKDRAQRFVDMDEPSFVFVPKSEESEEKSDKSDTTD